MSPFSKKDVLIKSLYEQNGYNAWQLSQNFQTKVGGKVVQ